MRKLELLITACFVMFSMLASGQGWSEIIEGKTFPNGLELKGKKNVLIRDCQISNPDGHNGILLDSCFNVRIEKCLIRRIGNKEMFFGNTRDVKGFQYISPELEDVHGIFIVNSKNIDVIGNEITDSFSKGITMKADGWQSSSDVLIEGNRIAYIYDDAIDFYTLNRNRDDARQHLALRGMTIRNNVIHDIGLGLTRLGFARHAIYLSTCDAVVEGNVIYNCFYGEGISIRSSAIVRNNKIWNCARACISYWAQMGVSNGNKKVIIENNECRQDFNMDFPMRHIGFPEKVHKLPIAVIILSYPGNSEYARMQEIVVRNNKLQVHADCDPTLPMIGGSGDISTASATYDISDNQLTDNRKEKIYFQNLPESVNAQNNILK